MKIFQNIYFSYNIKKETSVISLGDKVTYAVINIGFVAYTHS